MAEKKPALPTFDFSKRQRSSRLDILEGEQSAQAHNNPTQEEVAEEHEGEDTAVVTASVIAQPAEQREAALKPANSGSKTAKPKAVAKTAAVSEPESVKNRGGRPRGEVSKFKKNFYLAQTDLDNLEAAALNIATRARIRVKDDSSVVSLALAFLNDVAENGDQKQFEKLLKIYRQA